MKLEPLSALHSLGESTRARNLGEARDQASLKSSRTIAQTVSGGLTVKFEAAVYVLQRSKRNRLAG